MTSNHKETLDAAYVASIHEPNNTYSVYQTGPDSFAIACNESKPQTGLLVAIYRNGVISAK